MQEAALLCLSYVQEGYRCPLRPSCCICIHLAKNQRCPAEATTAYTWPNYLLANHLDYCVVWCACLLVWMIIIIVNYRISSSLMMCEPRVIECIMASGRQWAHRMRVWYEPISTHSVYVGKSSRVVVWNRVTYVARHIPEIDVWPRNCWPLASWPSDVRFSFIVNVY